MPGDEKFGDGLKLISYLRRNYPDIGIIVLTMTTNPLTSASLYDIGVMSVITKDQDLKALSNTLNLFMQGTSAQQKNTSQKITGSAPLPHGLKDRIADLSPRENEVLRLYAQGNSLTDIAHTLHRSITTISSQKSAAMRKLGIQTNHDLIAFCQKHNLF